ncbi:MAG: preprotein translocase subunit SecA [Minisyncoccia bacterium]
MSFLKKIFGDKHERAIKPLRLIVTKVNAFEEGIKALSDTALAQKTVEFKARLNDKETLDDILPEAFAVVREASRRLSGERHYDVQLIGGIALHQGSITEMRTGEGKTLVATLPVYLNALTGKGVHVVTVNDYLSRRDAVWMGQIYSFLGLSVGVLNHETSFLYDKDVKAPEKDAERDLAGSYHIVHDFLRPCARKQAYDADITYGTNNEFGFDYLRDNLEYEGKELRQREFNFAIVDEVDSILIDEARTPLIISAATTESGDLYTRFASIADNLKINEDFEVDEKLKTINMTDNGINHAEKLLGIENIYSEMGVKYVHHLQTAVRAKALFEKDKDYVVKDGEVIIVDEFTGRMQPGRRWSEGLHQAVEAKEGVKIQKESKTFASITFQNYFRLYKKLAGMTGTAMTSSEEFFKVYHLNTYIIPTNRDIKRLDRNDLIFQTENGKFKALAREVKERNKKGQPVLIGTVSIEKNELLSEYLKREGVVHKMLNAKNHEQEGEIIAQAGHKGAVTIATNMAGRGVDIKLGGVPFNATMSEEVKAIGGLFVLGTERHEARRIDNQLRGRSGRQGDPGETQFFVSLEDSLMRVFAKDTIKNMMGRFGIPEDQPIESYVITKSLETAQTKIEGFNFDSRKHILEYDDVLNFQRKTVYERRRSVLLGDEAIIESKLAEIVTDPKVKEIIEEKKKLLGPDFKEIIRRLILQTSDMFWVDHLEAMDYLRGSVNLRAYGQRDPLVEYKREGLIMFKEMQLSITAEVEKLIPHIGAGAFAQAEQKLREVKEQAMEISGVTKNADENTRIQNSNVNKVGRNDHCPCGSGKKYKHCHGKEK